MSLKLTINNEVVLMRKIIRQAKVHIIHKLAREVKLLKNKNGTDHQKQKYQRKASRLGDEIMILKKYNDDIISRHALTSPNNQNEIVNDQASTTEDRALARVTAHKLIQNYVRTFREKYPDPIDDYLQPGRKKQKRLKNQKRNAENKQKIKALKLSEKDSSLLNISNNNTELESTELQSPILDLPVDSSSSDGEMSDALVTDESTVENVNKNTNLNERPILSRLGDEDENLQSSKKQKTGEKSVKNKVATKIDEEYILKEESDDNGTEQQSKTLKTTNKSKTKVKTQIDEVRILRQENIEDDAVPATKTPKGKRKSVKHDVTGKLANLSTTPIVTSKNPLAEIKPLSEILNASTRPLVFDNSENTDLTTEKNIDSFFLSADGDREFLSVAVKKTDSEDTSSSKKNVQYNDNLNRRQRRQQNSGKFDRQIYKSNSYDTQQKNTKINPRLNSGGKNIKHEVEIKTLHPSWQAKKQQQPQILAFQGKKITFD